MQLHHNILFALLLVCCLSLQAQDIYFPSIDSEQWDIISHEELGWCDDKVDELITLNEDGNSKALIILKDGKIALEQYFGDHDATKNWYWASAGKSLTTSLIGIAQHDGILSIHDLTKEYLGEWTICDDANNNITVRHQLSMTTGLDYTLGINCTDVECLDCLNEEGQEWFYNNAPYTLLHNVLEHATNTDVNEYTRQKILDRIGMNGFWIPLDDNTIFFSTARSMARYGLMMLAGGDWDGIEILEDKMYYQDMISSSQNINPSYGYLWWLNGNESYRLPGSTFTFDGSFLPNVASDAYMAIGKNGQYILIIPSENVVIVRMGDSPDENLVPLNFLKEMMDVYNQLECTTSTNNLDSEVLEVELLNSICQTELKINNPIIGLNYRITNSSGYEVKNGMLKEDYIDVAQMRRGLYIISFYKGNQYMSYKFYKI